MLYTRRLCQIDGFMSDDDDDDDGADCVDERYLECDDDDEADLLLSLPL